MHNAAMNRPIGARDRAEVAPSTSAPVHSDANDAPARRRAPDKSAPSTAIRVEFTRLANLGIVARQGAIEGSSGENVLRIVVGSGRGSLLHDATMPPFLVAALRGTVRVIDGHCTRLLRSRRMFVAEHGGNLQIVGGVSALWVAMIAPAPLWRRLFEATADAPMSEPILLTRRPRMRIDATRSRRSSARRVPQRSRKATASRRSTPRWASRFAMLLSDLQSAFDARVERCPGRTQAQRRAVFSRLQRVHSCMEWGTDLSVEFPAFAPAAG